MLRRAVHRGDVWGPRHRTAAPCPSLLAASDIVHAAPRSTERTPSFCRPRRAKREVTRSGAVHRRRARNPSPGRRRQCALAGTRRPCPARRPRRPVAATQRVPVPAPPHGSGTSACALVRPAVRSEQPPARDLPRFRKKLDADGNGSGKATQSSASVIPHCHSKDQARPEHLCTDSFAVSAAAATVHLVQLRNPELL